MNVEAERALLAEYMAVCARLATGFGASCDKIATSMPIASDQIDCLGESDEERMLSFLKRFEQFEDALQRTIKTIVQVMLLGKAERLYPRDVANRAEQFGIVEDASEWANVVRTRNALAHEYPLQPEKRAAQVNGAWDARTTLTRVWGGIQQFVEREQLV